ncbi:hypothetical protein FOI42_RS03975 [Escherichia coli]|nr:hypothetical protein [Escherichia coli]
MKYILTFLITFMLITGCSNKVPVQASPIITQEILLERCEEDTPIPKKIVVDSHGNRGYAGDEILNVLTRWDSMYNECALRYDALIDTIRKLQDQNIRVNIKVKE